MTEDATTVTIDFSKRWFRELLKLTADNQRKVIKQEAIGAKLRWSRDMVARYIQILDKVVTENLNLAKSNQTGRVTEDAPVVTIDFTERWFRELLKLTANNQRCIIEELSWLGYYLNISRKRLVLR